MQGLIGIGGIAMAGIIGIIKSRSIIGSAFGLAARELKGAQGDRKAVRWQTDISMKHIAYFTVIALVAVFLFFWLGVINTFWQALWAWLVVTVIAFLFTTVAANAIAIVGSNPVSGMTIMTLIVAAGVFVAIGLKGTSASLPPWCSAALCAQHSPWPAALSPTSRSATGSAPHPRTQESWKFLGTLVSAATVGAVMMLLNNVYGFTGEGALQAPQANAMAQVIEPMMMGGDTPWTLYIIGALLAVLLNWLGVPALPFCLGMFLAPVAQHPMPVGGLVSYAVNHSSKKQEVCRAHATTEALSFPPASSPAAHSSGIRSPHHHVRRACAQQNGMEFRRRFSAWWPMPPS